jgi:hypothetical protein
MKVEVMQSSVTKIEVENCLRELLKKEGYKLRSKKGRGKLGADIKATINKEDWYFETIGTGAGQSSIEGIRDFYHAFFSAISRLNNKSCKHIIIAVPESLRKILPVRAKIYKAGWKRITEAFPELEIWLVDTENKSYQRTTWGYWLKHKK